MVKITADKLFLTILIITIITLITNYFWTALVHAESKYIIVALITVAFLGFSFAGVFAGISEAKSIKKKFLAGLIGNITLTVLFLIALFYVVLTLK